MVTKTTNALITLEMRRRVVTERRRLRREEKGEVGANYIYYLLEPHANVIRYVGATSSVASRFGDHISQCRIAKTPVSQWVRSLVDAGEIPRCEVVARVHTFGGAWSGWLWEQFAIRELEKSIVRHGAGGKLPNNLYQQTGEYTADLLNVEYLR